MGDVLVGRDRELAELQTALPGAGTSGAMYLIVGEPGIGKTRLAAELSTLARTRGIRTSWGRCWEAGGAPALWPWREVFESLGLAFPDPGMITANDPAEARFTLFREVAGSLAREATREPLVIVFEDLHAADRSTLMLLELVASQLRALPILIVGTYRDLEASLRADANDAIARINRAGHVLHLPRLREAEVAAIVRDTIADADDRLVATLYETTHGNPLFVDELVREVRARGAGAGIPIPLGVREIIRQRLGLVTEQTRRVLETGAVLGVEFDSAVIDRVVPQATATLDDAVTTGLLIRSGARLRFSHALYREALYHDLPRARRHELHRACAGALVTTDAPLAETAHHLLEAGIDAAPDAIDHAIRAATTALGVFAFEDATGLLERARAAIPPGPLEASLRARVLVATGEARIRSGDNAGRELCVEAATIARNLGDATLLANAGLAYGAVFTMGGVDPVLVGMLEQAFAILDTADSPLRARVMARLAAARQPSPMPERPRDIELALEAIAMARRVADRRDLIGVLNSACGALYGAAEPQVRLPIARELEQLAEELGDTTRLLQARVRIAMDHLELADLPSYAENATRYEQLAARIGPAAAPWRVPLMRSMCALATDDFEQSERWQEASRRIDSTHPRARRAQTFHRICMLRAAERHAALRASIPELRGQWLEMPWGVVLAESRVASVLARVGAEDEAREILGKLSERELHEEINAPSLAEAIWLAGDATLAEIPRNHLARYRDRWMVYWLEVEIIEAPVTRLLAYLTAICGDWIEADRLFSRALKTVEDAGRRVMAARMRFEYGDLLARAHREPERARALLAEARTAAATLGRSELVALIDRRHPTLSTTREIPTSTFTATFTMVLEGEYYAVVTARGPLRFKVTRGMQYLARLVGNPGMELHVLDLAGSTDHADRGDAGELLDGAAFRAYRTRLEQLQDRLEDAEARGDATTAASARDEMETIASELTKATGKGGKPRRAESAVDRARSAVQRRIKDALDRIAEQDAELGAWLRRAVTTGNYCIYRPGA
jgi:hypothetical protein